MDDIKLICFDLDQTIISQSSWKQLNFAMGISYEEDHQMYEAYLKNEFNYVTWTAKICERYKQSNKANKKDITEILSNYKYADGAVEAVKYVQQKGYKTALISGSMDLLVNMVAKDLSIDFAEACNTLVFDEDKQLADIIPCVSDTSAKVEYLQSICDRLGITLSQCVCVGDGANDIALFRATGHGITFADSNIKDEAWKVISDLGHLKTVL